MGIRSALMPMLVLLLTGLVQWPFFDLWFSFMDEGHMLQFADMANQGGEFYRDATFYPLPGAFHFLSLIFDLWGPSILVSRWVVLLQFAVFASLFFVVLRRVTGSQSWAWLGVLALWAYRIWCFPHWQMYSYSTTSLLVFLACGWVLLIYFQKQDRWILGVSGFLYGLGVLCKQDYGAAVGLAIALTLFLFFVTERQASRPRGWDIALTFLVPAAAVGAATGFYYWQAGLLEDLLRFTVFNHFQGMGAYEYTEFPDLFPLWGQDPGYRTDYSILTHIPAIIYTTDWNVTRSHFLFTDTPLYDGLMKLFFYGPLVLLVGSGVKLWVRRERLHDIEGSDGRQKSLSEFLIFAMAGGLILLVWLNKPQDYVHLAVLYWPLVALSVFHAHDVLSGHRRRKWIALAIFIIPMLTFAGYSGRLLQKFHEQYDIFLEMERARIYVSSEEAVMLDQVVKYIHENSEADEAVAILPYFPMAHFLANRLGPHRSAYIVWPFPEIPNRDEAIVESMEALETDLVIYNFTQFYSFDPVWEHAPVLFEYLVDNFTIHRVFNTENWVRPPVALGREVLEVDSPVAQILSVNQEGASLWVEQKSAPPRFVSPDVREVYLKEMLWPFRRVIALRPSSGGRESVFSVPLHVPKGGAHLKTAFAVHPQWWSELSSTWVEFGLRLRVGDEVIPLHRQRLEPSRFFQDRAWFELDIDLGEWAGQDVRVEFLNSAGSPRGESLWMAGWEQPEVTVSLQGDGDSANLGLGEDWTEGSSEN